MYAGASIGRLTREYHGAYTLYQDSCAMSPEIRSVLLSDPDHLFDSGQTIQSLWKNAATDKTVVKIGVTSYFLKRYNCLGWGYRLKNLFRHSRALKSWRIGWKFLEMGMPIPHPICCLEERRLRVLGRSYLLYELLEGASSLLDSWPDFSSEQKGQILKLLGTKIGKMHRFGLLHGDLNWRNILVRDRGCDAEVFFVDLDGSRWGRRLSRQMAEKDLSHFYRDLQRNDVNQDAIQLFVKAWEDSFLNN